MANAPFARLVTGSFLVLQSLLLAGCGAQMSPSQTSPSPPPKLVQVPGAPTASPSPAMAPFPNPTSATNVTNAADATKLAELPEYMRFTPEPTMTPRRDVEWFVDLIRSSQAMTVTAWDSETVQVQIDQAGRQQLVEAAGSGTIATVSGDEWLAQYLPFPGYGLKIDLPPPYQATVHWASTTHFIVSWLNGPEDNNPVVAYYLQRSGALWSAVSRLAPVSRYAESSVRYLLYANSLRVVMDEYDYTLSGENNHIVIAARGLANGTLTKAAAPEQKPMILLYFTVNNVTNEVKVWDNYFTYNEHVYRLQDIGPGIRSSLAAD